VVSLAVGSLALYLGGGTRSGIRLLLVLAGVVQGIIWANGLVSFWIRRYAEEKAETEPASLTTLNAIGFAVRFAIWTVLLLVALDTLGVNITALVTGLGITGIAVALAVQSILGDLFGALTIVLDKPFVVGDAIEVDQVAGTVENIGLKTTRVRSANGELVVISNSDLLKSRIRNFKQMTERRAVLVTTLSPETTPEQLARAPKIAEEVVSAQTLARLERSRVRAITDAGFEIETSFFVQSPEFRIFADTRQSVLLGLAASYRREHIALAFRALPAPVTPASPPPR
jgi:small-conductance mechanosensitive channel